MPDSDNSVKPPCKYNSLREIYAARLKYQQTQQKGQPLKETDIGSLNNLHKKNCKNTNLLVSRYERRQRNVYNQPDVVPKPPPLPI